MDGLGSIGSVGHTRYSARVRGRGAVPLQIGHIRGTGEAQQGGGEPPPIMSMRPIQNEGASVSPCPSTILVIARILVPVGVYRTV